MVLVTNGINNKIKYEGEHSPVPGIARKGWKLNSSLLGKEMPVSRAQKSALRSWSKTLQQNEGLMPNMINYGHGPLICENIHS